VLFTGNKVVALSEDHKPDNAEELARITKAKHYVEDSRVDGNLALSRAFGDFQYKDQPQLTPQEQAVTIQPDLVTVKRSKEDKYIIVACDGIWDCLSNEECCDSVNKKLEVLKPSKEGIHKITEQLLDDILAPNTEDGIGTDNMTCIVSYFPEAW